MESSHSPIRVKSQKPGILEVHLENCFETEEILSFTEDAINSMSDLSISENLKTPPASPHSITPRKRKFFNFSPRNRKFSPAQMKLSNSHFASLDDDVNIQLFSSSGLTHSGNQGSYADFNAPTTPDNNRASESYERRMEYHDDTRKDRRTSECLLNRRRLASRRSFHKRMISRRLFGNHGGECLEVFV